MPAFILKNYFLPFIILLSFNVQAQQKETLKGKIFDAETKKPIPFCTIYYLKKNVGAVTNSLGNFNLLVENRSDSVEVSIVGYKKKRLSISQIFQQGNTILLDQYAIKLSDVVVSQKSKKVKKTNKEFGFYKYYRPSFSSGNGNGLGEISGIYIANTIDGNPKKIIALKYAIKSNAKALVRLQLYDKNTYTGLPGKTLIPKDLTVKVKKNQNRLIVDISKYNIMMPSDGVFITLQHLGELNDDGSLSNRYLNVSPQTQSFHKLNKSFSYASFWEQPFKKIVFTSRYNSNLYRNECFGISVIEYEN